MAVKLDLSLGVNLLDWDGRHHDRAILVNCENEAQQRELIMDATAQCISKGGITIYIKPDAEDLHNLSCFNGLEDFIKEIIANNQWGNAYIRDLKDVKDIEIIYAIENTSEFESEQHTEADPNRANIIFSTPNALFRSLHQNVSDSAYLDNCLLLVIDGFDKGVSKSDQIRLLELLRSLTFQPRNPLFAVILVQNFDESSRDNLVSLLKIETFLEPAIKMNDIKTKFSITLNDRDIRDYLTNGANSLGHHMGD